MSETMRVTCTCGAKLKAPATLAGKECACPRCRQPVRVPAIPYAAVATAPAVAPSRVADGREAPPRRRKKRQRSVNQNTNVNHVHVQVGEPPRHRRWSPGVAAVLSLFFPGLGQLYKGQLFNGLAWFIVVLAGYAFFVLPGLFLHFCCVIGAASGDPYH